MPFLDNYKITGSQAATFPLRSPYAEKHLEAYKTTHYRGHLVQYYLHSIPVIGSLVALVEVIAHKLFNPQKKIPAPNPQVPPPDPQVQHPRFIDDMREQNKRLVEQNQKLEELLVIQRKVGNAVVKQVEEQKENVEKQPVIEKKPQEIQEPIKNPEKVIQENPIEEKNQIKEEPLEQKPLSAKNIVIISSNEKISQIFMNNLRALDYNVCKINGDIGKAYEDKFWKNCDEPTLLINLGVYTDRFQVYRAKLIYDYFISQCKEKCVVPVLVELAHETSPISIQEQMNKIGEYVMPKDLFKELTFARRIEYLGDSIITFKKSENQPAETFPEFIKKIADKFSDYKKRCDQMELDKGQDFNDWWYQKVMKQA